MCPNPGSCNWTTDNLLQDGGFNNLPHPIWKEINVFESLDEQDLNTLRTDVKSAPGDHPWSAVLGGVDDTDENGDGQEDHGLFEHAVFQLKAFPNNIEMVSIEYAYYLTTEESDYPPVEWDKFFVDLQVGGLSLDNSLLGQPIKYTNLHPYKDDWRWRGRPAEQGGDGFIIVEDMLDHAGKAVYLVFYSEVDRSAISTFYIDAVQLRGCIIN